MLGHRTILVPFVRFLCCAVLFVLTAGLASAQTPINAPDKPKAETTPTKASSDAAEVPASSVAEQPTSVATGSTESAIDMMNASVSVSPPKTERKPEPGAVKA